MKAIQRLALCAGFAAFLGMNGFSLWGIHILPFELFGSNFYINWSLPLLLSNLVGFIIFAWDTHRDHPRIPEFPLAFACGLFALSMIFLFAATATTQVICIVLSALLMGLATTCCFICWEEILGHLPDYEAKLTLICGSIGSLIPIVIGLNVGSSLVLLVFISVIFVQVSLLYVVIKGLSSSHQPSVTTTKLPSFTFFMRPMFCIMIIGSLTPMLGSFADFSPTPAIDSVTLILSGNVISALMLACAWKFIPRISITQAFGIIAPFLITTILFFPFLIPEYRIIIRFFSTLGFSLFSIVMMMYCVDVSRSQKISLRYTYAMFAIVTYASQLFATGISETIRLAFPLESQLMYIHAAVLVIACCFAMLILYRSALHYTSRPTSEHEGTDKISAICDNLAHTYKLTMRQREVLTLMAHGFDVPGISQKLVLSENTVRTHVKNLYSIFGVHSRRELIELINSPNQTDELPLLSPTVITKLN